ncbi:MAG: peptide ABC transporter substrate-binding protein [Actinomycetota bacterium]|nr:peptide ABC transporter substrate-binding protein [Actinomycetota bacterium]
MTLRKLCLTLAALASLAFVAAGCGGGGDNEGEAAGQRASDQTMTIAWGAEPPSLDPGLATDTTSANVLLNIMDPLVKLEGENLEPKPNLAQSWRTSNGGRVYTFKLRPDGKWTNGDRVTAEDFEYSWKRVLDPKLAADYAYQLYGIEGAQEYNECKRNCGGLRDQVGVEAVDDSTLRVTLTSAQPWFPQLVAHHSFLAVHRPTVERYGNNWTEARNIVTNGPFRLARWEHESRIDLAKWDGWRNAADVTLQRVNGRIITEGTTAVQAFEAGEVDVVETGIPPQEIPRLKDTPAYQQYPALGTYYYGFNLKNVPDVNQRRAMSLAIDRRTIIDNISQQGEIPANGFTPQGIAGFDTVNVESQWAPERADVERAKELMANVENPKRNVTIFYNNAPGHKEIAVAIQDMWKELGISATIKQQEWAQFLEFLGPPPNKAVDVYRLGWIYDYPDAMNGLELWTCGSGNNNTNWCNKRFDSLVAQARRTPADNKRYQLYRQMEQIMFGENGDMPLIPIYWYTTVTLENDKVRDTFNVNPQTFFDFSEVEVRT